MIFITSCYCPLYLAFSFTELDNTQTFISHLFQLFHYYVGPLLEIIVFSAEIYQEETVSEKSTVS